MATRMRTVVLIVSALAALILAAVIVAWLLIGTDGARERLEVGLAEALDMDVKIGQPMRFELLGGANVTLADLEVSSNGRVVAAADSVSVRLALFSLLTGAVRPLDLHIERPELLVERYSPGVFNIYQPGPEPGMHDELSLRRVRVSDARLIYFDQASELEWFFEHCDLDMRDIRHAGGVLEHSLATLAAEGGLECRSLVHDRFAASGLSAEIRGENGVFELEPVSALAFDGQASGRIEVDFSSGTPGFRLENRISELDIGAFMTILEPDQETAGKMELELDLNAHGRTWQHIRDSVAGTISLSAGEIILDGYDLDDELDTYADTQRFNLVDVGAVFLAGPVGLVATRGYAFSGLLQGRGGSTRIDRMVSKWTVEGGVAQARDVAFRTPENRLALAGGLHFGEYRFEEMRVAVIDLDGCAVVEQRISGPFREPEIEQPNFLVTVAGPLIDLVRRGVRTISDGDCEVFYSGSISHP